jgi:hypothetical protein
MILERVFRGIVGGLVLAGAGLTIYHSPNWIYFTVFLGLMLLQSGFTDRCPLIWLLQKAGLKRCEAAAQERHVPASKPLGGSIR